MRMRVTLRLIVALALTVAAVAWFSAFFQARQERARAREELDRRSRLAAEGLQETLENLLPDGASPRLRRLAERFRDRKGLSGLAVYAADGKLLAASSNLAGAAGAPPAPAAEALARDAEGGAFVQAGGRRLYVYARPVRPGGLTAGALALFHDAGELDERLRRARRETFLRVLAQTFLIAGVTLLIVRWSVAGPIAVMAEWMKRLRAGEEPSALAPPGEDIFAPIAREASTFATQLLQAKHAAEEEARLRRSSEALWTAERLKEHIKAKLQGRPLFLVSNREPYAHQRRGRRVEWAVPAGGLVTALDPVMRASGGTWIAHGSGDADWETADERGRLRVPPGEPAYTLRRVPLTKEEENGYYYGFSNEGLWPLCHIAHTRPVFRAEDWREYQAVNRKFAEVALEEMAGVEEPCVLIQDYHFALLPRYIKAKRPDARVALFWHIPWPNAEAFSICPWQRELLDGMLGADLLGFHIQSHCNNFLETVDRALESRIDWERFSVTKRGHATLVKPFPISVAFPEPPSPAPPLPDRAAFMKEEGFKAEVLAVGVDRMDYTKGVLERLRAVERFLDKYPRYQGRFVLAQIGAPSRTHIKRYHDFLAEVEAETERINWRFKSGGYKPVVFLKKQHSHDEIRPFYKYADACLVTSLHDGMNLVAKEFVAARDDERGALILSRFTGAARELRDALLVNPYDVEQMADALRYALEMGPEEQRSRMRRMREVVRENNIYLWAGNLIEELTRVRLPAPESLPETQGRRLLS